EAFAGEGVFLVHREFAGGLRGTPLLSSADPFDLVVIDEAHEVFSGIYKRYDKEGHYNSDSSEAQIADRVRSFLKPTGTPVLLLTATPIQNSLTELWGLVQYVEPTDQLLGKLPTFREIFCDSTDRGLNEDQTFELRRRLGSVVQRTLRRQAQEFLEVPFVERQTKLVEYSMSPSEKQLYDHVTAWLLDPYLCSFGGRNRRLLLIGFHRRMGSSLAALQASLTKVAERLRKQLRDGREESWDELVQDLTVEFEEDLDDLADVSQAFQPDSQARKPDLHEEAVEPPAREKIRAELELIEGFIAAAQAIERDSKAECLIDALKVIRERGEQGVGTGKAVIFTESVKTQDFLYELLTKNGYLPAEVTLFRGQNDHARAREALSRWED
ncbi:MAG TPA: SNF2-related protein, partial [Planctomycetaceae bacterium]|nr:SNF2-related protein [Planctomycetaceae bacterium]